MIQRTVLFVAAATLLSYGQGFSSGQPSIVDSAVVEQQFLERAQGRASEHQFTKRANRVAALWMKLTEEFNDKHTFNIKLARQISRAFRELEKDDSWPKDRSK